MLLRRLLPVAVAVVTAATGGAEASGNANPFAGRLLYVDSHSPAAHAAAQLRQSHPGWAAELDKIAKEPQADWFGDWNPTDKVGRQVAARRQVIESVGAMPQFVVYDIPLRDCHGFSGGGARSAADYRAWVRHFAAGVGTGPAAVIVEPDALAGLDCLSPPDRTTRLALVRFAVRTLSSHPRTAVYLDSGHSGWQPVAVMAQRLRAADVADARGFSLNVSNFDPTNVDRSYGHAIAAKIGGKHFVIDTSRNGRGSSGDWCNPLGRALGHRPTAATGDAAVDAYLWIKRPGESDGTCHGGPPAGRWWTSYAVGLASRAAY